MRTTKTLLATLAVGIAFAGPAFAEKMKATLDAKSEIPPIRAPARALPTSTMMLPPRS